MKAALCSLVLLCAVAPLMGVVGCAGGDPDTIPETVQTRIVYYAMPG